MNAAPSKNVVVLRLSSPINSHQNYSGSLPTTSQIGLKSHFENVVVCLNFYKSLLAALEPENLTEMALCQATLWDFWGFIKHAFMAL